MSSFSQDKKWMEAKKAVGYGNYSWLDVVSYYRFIDGTNVFVYSVIEGDKRLIVDVLDSGQVLLVTREGKLITDDYRAVLESRKIFKYSRHFEKKELPLGSEKYTVILESN